MKAKHLSLISLIILVAVLVSCGSNVSTNDRESPVNGNDNGNNGIESNEDITGGDRDDGSDQPRDIFQGKITAGTPFSEGLAVVTDGEKTCCINTRGEIIFTLSSPVEWYLGGTYSRGFHHGLVMIGEDLYDTTGKKTTPEDLGVTKFYDHALSAGYIIAVKDESTYNGTKISVGILNPDFEWIIPLSEELKIDENIGLHKSWGGAIDGYIFEDSNGGWVFEVATSKYYDYEKAPAALGEYLWQYNYYSNCFVNNQYETVLTLEGENPEAPGEWVNGKHIVTFYNKTAEKQFFTLVDTTGQVAFDPIEIPRDLIDIRYTGTRWAYDGRYVMVCNINRSNAYMYDTVEHVSYTTEDFQSSASIILQDGVMAIYTHSTANIYRVNYYTPDFKALF